MSEEVIASGKPEQERPVNTRRLQVFELNHFMLHGYGALFDGVGFTNIQTGTQYSFNQAVELFNDRPEKGEDGYVLDRVKLRYIKKTKSITCTSHWVKPVDEFHEKCEDDGVPVFSALQTIMKTLRLR